MSYDETDGLQQQTSVVDQQLKQTQRCTPARRRCLGISAVVAAILGAAFVVLVLVLGTDPADLPPPCTTGCANFSHALWTDVLAVRLRPSSRGGVNYAGFDYEGLRGDQTDFREYLQQLAQVDLALLGVTERKALFINAYNALAVRVLLDECGGQLCESIRDLDYQRSPLTVWKQGAGQVGGGGEDHLYSLDNIEHDRLRNTEYFQHDPRIHAAVNCASVSCPDLFPEAFEVETLDEQLDDAMRAWMAHPTKGLAADMPGNRMTLSKIFSWYTADFDAPKNPGGKLAFVARYAPDTVATWLRTPALPILSYFDYDWTVNKAT
jgi:hypothetical protein